jgi:hypothetical protein
VEGPCEHDNEPSGLLMLQEVIKHLWNVSTILMLQVVTKH